MIHKFKKGNIPWNKGKIGLQKHSKESIKKISESQKGRMHSEETRKNISEKLKGIKRLPFSLEHRKKISEAHKGKKGKKMSEETKKKISKAKKKEWAEGKRKFVMSGMLNKKHSEKTKQKMSENRKGNKHWNWLGGKSFELYSIDWTETLKRSIRERDGYLCKICNKNQIEELEKYNRKLSIHHIDYNKQNQNPNNLITLCHSCHTKTNYDRDYWINYF